MAAILPVLTMTSMIDFYVLCMHYIAETRHYYPRLERKRRAVPERDGRDYLSRFPDLAVHSLVPEPYLLWPGLARPLQG